MHYTFKIIIAGDGGVGKTTLVDKYVTGLFKDNSRITLGVQFMVKRLNVEGHQIDLQIWDFGGEERFRFLLPAYCRGVSGAIFMYDVTSPSSLYHIDDWLGILRSQGGHFPLVVAGTKADLGSSRKVSTEEATSIAHRCDIPDVVEVSAKTGQNVDTLFERLCFHMVKANQPQVTYPYPRTVPNVVSLTI